jgi:hypothetical protein
LELDKDKQNTTDDTEAMERREFLKKVGKAGATAPAVSLMMAATIKSGNAIAETYSGGSGSGSAG